MITNIHLCMALEYDQMYVCLMYFDPYASLILIVLYERISYFIGNMIPLVKRKSCTLLRESCVKALM